MTMQLRDTSAFASVGVEGVLDTFPKLLLHRAAVTPDLVAFREKEFGIWQTLTWKQIAVQVEGMALGLIASGFARGDTLAILGKNRPNLYSATFAAQAVGGIPVPLFSDGTSNELLQILKHCRASVAIVEDQEQVDKILPLLGSLPHLKRLYFLEPRGMRNYDHPQLASVESLVATGAAAGNRPGIIADEIARSNGSNISIVCYTSGTTGLPKGVMLSFDNLITTARNMAQLEGLTVEDRTLAYLPMAWIGDHFFSFAQASVVGFTVNCPENQATVMGDLREIAPTYFFAPPRVFEGILTDIAIRMQNASIFKQFVYDALMKIARRTGVRLLEGRPVGVVDRMLYRFGETLLYRPMLNTLGLNHVRVAYTAGEALGPEIFDFFRGLGVNIKQLYGQTESSVYVCVHRNDEVRSDTVGAPAPGVEISFSDRGELLYRSPGVFVSYFDAPDEANAIKNAEGWVKSGDAAVLTEGGQVRIIDRVKDVGRTDDGKLFPPKYIENKLKFFFSIKEAVAFGDGRPYVAAFINVDLEAVSNWAERRKIAFSGYADLASRPEVYDLVREHIKEMNRGLLQDAELSHCVVKRFLILPKELDADDGELTRTRKVRRRVIAERYGRLIEALYGDEDIVSFDTTAQLEDGRLIKVAADVRVASVAQDNAMGA